MGMSQNPLVKVPKITQNRSWLLYLWMFSGYLVLTHTQYHLTVGIIITIILIVIIPIFKIYSSPGVDRTWKNQTDLPGWWFGTFFIFPFSWE